MSERDGRMYVATRLVKESESNLGLPIRVADDDCAGCLFVFWTKKAARECYGNDVGLVEIRAQEPDDE
jgi:hypothetical protein